MKKHITNGFLLAVVGGILFTQGSQLWLFDCQTPRFLHLIEYLTSISSYSLGFAWIGILFSDSTKLQRRLLSHISAKPLLVMGIISLLLIVVHLSMYPLLSIQMDDPCWLCFGLN